MAVQSGYARGAPGRVTGRYAQYALARPGGICAVRNWQRCSIEPGHADEAGIASPFRCRILPGDRAICATHAGEETERCGIFGVPHVAPVHRLTCMFRNARSAIEPLSRRTL
jgi:hypothetical protein